MDYIKRIIKGMFMGVANIIPGVSGGTMAVSMGIYDDIIYSITHLFKEFKKSVFTLLPYAIGMALGLVGLSFVIEFLLDNYNFQTNWAFIGLILGGLPAMFQRVKGKKMGTSHGAIFAAFFVLIIGMQFLGGKGSADADLTLSVFLVIKLFFIGVIASATMVIPGVSGSMILMILGFYNPILECVTGFIKAAVQVDIAGAMSYVGVLLPFGIGVLVGIFAIAKLIEWLLGSYETHTFCGILGLVIASPIAILMNATIGQLGIMKILMSVVVFLIGYGIAFKLGEE